MNTEKKDEDFHDGLVVRTTREYLLLWSPVHDLVRAPEYGLSAQWALGSWVHYRAIAEDTKPNCLNAVSRPAFTAYEILRMPIGGSFPDVEVRHESDAVQIELTTFVTGPLRHRDAKTVLADDFLLGAVLCEANAEFLRKFEDNVNGLIEIKVIFTEEFPGTARFVALAFRDDLSEEWIEFKNPKRKDSQSEQNPSEPKAFGTLAKSKQTNQAENDGTIPRNGFGTLLKSKQVGGVEEDAINPSELSAFGTFAKIKQIGEGDVINPSGRSAFCTFTKKNQIDAVEDDVLDPIDRSVFVTSAKTKQTNEASKGISSIVWNSYGTLVTTKQTNQIEDNGVENCFPSTSNKFRPVDEQSISPNSFFSLSDDLHEEKIEFTDCWNDAKPGEHGGGEQEGESSNEMDQDREAKIIAEMVHYQKEHFEGASRRKRSFGLVVEKMLDYAIVYSKRFGLSIVPSSRFSSLQQFDSLCVVGQWLLSVILRVPNSSTLGLSFTHTCFPPFERTEQKNIQTFVTSEGKVEILLNCDFSISNLKALSTNQFVLSTQLGDVLVSEAFIRQNDILENVSNVWVRYIGGKYFFWEIDTEAKITTDDDDTFVCRAIIDDEPHSVATELASIVFTCDGQDDQSSFDGITNELVSVFAANFLSSEKRTESIEEQTADEATVVLRNNGGHNGINANIVDNDDRQGISSQAAADNADVEPINHGNGCDSQLLQPTTAQNDFASVYYFAKTFWPRLCKDNPINEEQNISKLDEGNPLKCENSNETGNVEERSSKKKPALKESIFKFTLFRLFQSLKI